jgi:hypothetical protein
MGLLRSSVAKRLRRECFASASPSPSPFDLSEILGRTRGCDLKWGATVQVAGPDIAPTCAVFLLRKGWIPWRIGRSVLLPASVC